MLYLMSKIFIYLIAAAFLGWLIGRAGAKQRERRLEEELREIETRYASLEDYRDRINKENFSLKEENRNKSRELAHFKRLTEDNKVKSQTFEMENSDTRTRLDQLREKLESQERQTRREREALAVEVENLKTQRQEMMERHQKLIQEKKALEAQLKSPGNKDLNTLEKEYHALRSDRKKLSAQVELLLAERADYEERVQNLMKEQQELSRQVRELKKNQVSSEQLEELTTQIMDIRSERDDYFNRLRTISNVIEPCA